MFLDVQHLHKSFGNKVAIKDVNFHLEKGKLLCLLGPSGCGKSTILNALGGFLTLDSGKILLDGIDITCLPPEDRQIATVFQSYGLFPHMSVIENIQYGLKFLNYDKSERYKLAMDMIDKMNLLGNEKKKISQLSGGQQQRVALGRSLIIQPHLLLLDEPLSNLDAKLRVSLREEIRRIQREFNVTMVFVTHDQLEAFEIADNIILMNQGKIVQQGTAQELYYTPANEFVLSFIGSSYQEKQQYIRPEYVSINNEKIGYHGVVESIIFQGPTSKILIRLDSGKMVESLKLSHQVNVDIGDEIFVQYNLSDIPSHPS